MSDTVVSLLTPQGTGAIATIEVTGPRAWELARQLFKPAGKPLPESLEVNRFWFGTLGSDEVVLAITSATTIEIHCHGGRRVVRWVIEQFLASGCIEGRPSHPKGEGLGLLQQSPTLRTASILLDQLNGAFANEVRRILAILETNPPDTCDPLRRLAELGNTVGRHLVEPWKVVIAGPPNVGKSSLVNALAGYQRSVVSEVAGTTRDAVNVRTAFDGWPVELIDTAGLRDAEGLEAEGINRTRDEMESADLVLWVMDGTAPKLAWPSNTIPREKIVTVINKSDAMIGWGSGPDAGDAWGVLLVSALTGQVERLVAELISKLVPTPPGLGGAVPYSPPLTDFVQRAFEHASQREWAQAVQALQKALVADDPGHVG